MPISSLRFSVICIAMLMLPAIVGCYEKTSAVNAPKNSVKTVPESKTAVERKKLASEKADELLAELEKEKVNNRGTAEARQPEAVASALSEATAKVPLIPRKLLFGNPDKSAARISHDGKYLSYLAPVNGVMNVWVGPIDDPDAAKASHQGHEARHPLLLLGIHQQAHPLRPGRRRRRRLEHLPHEPREQRNHQPHRAQKSPRADPRGQPQVPQGNSDRAQRPRPPVSRHLSARPGNRRKRADPKERPVRRLHHRRGLQDSLRQQAHRGRRDSDVKAGRKRRLDRLPQDLDGRLDDHQSRRLR